MKSVGSWPIHPPIMLNLHDFRRHFTPFTQKSHLLRFKLLMTATVSRYETYAYSFSDGPITTYWQV